MILSAQMENDWLTEQPRTILLFYTILRVPPAFPGNKLNLDFMSAGLDSLQLDRRTLEKFEYLPQVFLQTAQRGATSTVASALLARFVTKQTDRWS